MFKIGDKVKYYLDDDTGIGIITELKGHGYYIVTSVEDEEDRIENKEFSEEDLELLPIVYISKEDLIKLVRYEVKMVNFIPDKEDFAYEFEDIYEPDIEDLITCLSNIIKNLDYNDNDYQHWHIEMFLGNLGEGLNIYSMMNEWEFFRDNARVEKISDRMIIGMILSKMSDWDFFEKNHTDKKSTAEKMYKDLVHYENNKTKTVVERFYPADLQKTFISYYYNKDFKTDMNDDEIILFKKFVHDLVSEGDLNAKEILGYCYYTGSKVIQNDWIKARDIFIELYNETGNPGYANTLGYIFYYGRCTNGKPEYDKAYRYFSIGAINGYYESSYKLADMFTHGYGVPVNKKTALRLYSNVYQENLELIEKEEFRCKFADAALRMGGAMENELDECDPVSDSYYYYLQADFAIRKRLQYDFYGDQVVYNGIQKSLKRIKDRLKKESVDKKLHKFNVGALGLIGSHKYPVKVKIKYLKDSIRFTTSRVYKRNDEPTKYLLTVCDCSYCDLVDEIVFRCEESIDIDIVDHTDEFIFNEVEYDFDGAKFYYDGILTAFIEESQIIWECPAKKIFKSVENRFVSIRFSPNGREYDYLCDDDLIQIGDHVIVDGYSGETEVVVTDIFVRQDDESGLPIDRYKKIKRKV